MVSPQRLPALQGESLQAYRLVNSKFPPIALFDDVADADEFELLYQIQALTNPRLQNEVGQLELIRRSDIPFGIPGCSYAIAPFTHINPAGSRFSDGRFGVLYLADSMPTALAEVRYHQNQYWSKVPGLGFERFVFRGLSCSFSQAQMQDATALPLTDPIYAPDDYRHAQIFGKAARDAASPGFRYHSVRLPGSHCWALLTPKPVTSMVQTEHYEMIWNGQVTSVNRFTQTPTFKE